jgi:CHASE2 domain-containing sensor protein
MAKQTRILAWIGSRRRLELIVAALVASVLSVVISELPKMDLLKAAVNDDNFTDLVQSTRGELPIDTSIHVVTFDQSIFDSSDMVDRSLLAMHLAALMQLEPRAVGVDFLIDSLRPSAPDGDTMLAGLIADNPNLIFGVFHQDSLKRFDIPPPFFKLREGQLGCINLMPDEDNTIRTYAPVWGLDEPRQFESFDLKLARLADSSAAAYLASFSNESFIIDYAAGIGETKREGSAGDQIFPVFPLQSIFEIVSSGDSVQTEALRSQFTGKTVLVGYGDLRNSQVTSVVDRFYTPFKPGENSLPDMHGVAIHANILNTILKRRVVAQTPLWANIVWGAGMILLLLAGRERIKRVKSPAAQSVLTYAGFALLFMLGALLPVLAFRYTPYKFSIFIPIGGLLLAVPALEGLRKGIDLMLDIRRRARLREPLPGAIRAGMTWILKTWNDDERMERAIHFLQSQWHAACAVLFAEAAAGNLPKLSPGTVASPTLARVVAEIDRIAEEEAEPSRDAERAMLLLRALDAEPVLHRTLRLSRSLYIAMNEIRRQSIEGESESSAALGAESGAEKELRESIAGYTDLAIKALEEKGAGETKERFNELYAALERYAARGAAIMRGADGLPEDLPLSGERYAPFIFSSRCRLHHADETFIYFGQQEDANSRDDFFDLVFMGRTIRCQPDSHLGLTRFREKAGLSVDAAAAVDAAAEPIVVADS